MELPSTDTKPSATPAVKPFDLAQPTVVLIHGVLNDHSVWGHARAIPCPPRLERAGGRPRLPPLQKCRPGARLGEEAADFIIALWTPWAHRVLRWWATAGTRWIALEVTRPPGTREPPALGGHGLSRRVSPALIEAALNEAGEGAAWSTYSLFGTLRPPTAGSGHLGVWRQHGAGPPLLVQQPRREPVPPGFVAWVTANRGDAAIARITCPVLFALGAQDQMTTFKAAQGLVRRRAVGRQTVRWSVCREYHQMTEAPEETLAVIRDFLSST